MHPNSDRAIAALLGILALLIIAVALVVTVTITHKETDPTPYVAMILGWIGLAIPSLGAMFWSVRVSHDVRNHVVKDKAVEAFIEAYPDALDRLSERLFKDDENNGR